ncbi:MAG: hypothetical protein PWR01_217 [Clostridiales bacterium]|nr:hypothetical protein [Clostridiales bacterium]
MAPAFNFYKGDLTLAIKNKTTSNCVENLYIFKFCVNNWTKFKACGIFIKNDNLIQNPFLIFLILNNNVQSFGKFVAI